MRRPSAAYTGGPLIPSQMPPTRSISGGGSRTTIMSRPGAIPSGVVPSTGPVNGWGVGPEETVSPSTGWPAVTPVIGAICGHWASAGGGTDRAGETGREAAAPASDTVPRKAASGRRKRMDIDELLRLVASGDTGEAGGSVLPAFH